MPQTPASRKFHALFRPCWTHQAIATELGCSRQLVGAWASGKRTPTAEAIAALWALLARAPLARLAESPKARLQPWESRAVAARVGVPTWGQLDRSALFLACQPRWSQSDMAAQLRRSRQIVCSYANGKATPSGRIAAHIEKLEPEIRTSEWFE